MTSWSRLKRHVIVQLHTHVCDNSSAQAQTRPVPWMFSWELTLVITSLLDSAVFQPLARYFLPPCVRAHGSSGPGLSPPPRWLVGDVAPFFFPWLPAVSSTPLSFPSSPLASLLLLVRDAGCGSPRTEVLDRQSQPPGREEAEPWTPLCLCRM